MLVLTPLLYWKVTVNGSPVTSYSQNIVTNTNSKLVANRFSRNGFYFDGWNTRADGLGTAYTNTQLMNISENITLYAQWRTQVGQ